MVAGQMRQNYAVREAQIQAHQNNKRKLMEDQLSHIKDIDERKISIIDRHVNYKIKKTEG